VHGVREIVAVYFGCEGWSLRLREEERLGVFENRVLRVILEPKGEGEQEAEEHFLMRRFIICTPRQFYSDD
jgi:hypothetical protein